MELDDDEVAAFLARYADACADAGIEPLPMDDLRALAEAILTGRVAGSQTLQ
jgi:hypothetical protein